MGQSLTFILKTARDTITHTLRKEKVLNAPPSFPKIKQLYTCKEQKQSHHAFHMCMIEMEKNVRLKNVIKDVSMEVNIK